MAPLSLYLSFSLFSSKNKKKETHFQYELLQREFESINQGRQYGGYYSRRVPRALSDVVALTRYRGLHFSFLCLGQGESPPRWVTSVEKR